MSDFSLDSTRTSSRSRSGSTTSPRTVIRPAAEEWDEREEIPWPIVEEAAKIGLYSLGVRGQRLRRPDSG